MWHTTRMHNKIQYKHIIIIKLSASSPSTATFPQSYMEEHLKDKERLKNEWDELTNNDPEPCSIVAAIEPANMRKNRCTDIMPCAWEFTFMIITKELNSFD